MSNSEDQESINLPPDSFHWFISRNGLQEGPMVNAEFQKLVGLGHLAPTDFVWRNGMENWVPASEVLPPPSVTQSLAGKNNINSVAEQQVKVDNYIAAHKKSYGISLFLTILFGPFGLFYIGIILGIVVAIVDIVVVLVSLIPLFTTTYFSEEMSAFIFSCIIAFVYLLNISVAAIFISKYNNKVRTKADLLVK